MHTFGRLVAAGAVMVLAASFSTGVASASPGGSRPPATDQKIERHVQAQSKMRSNTTRFRRNPLLKELLSAEEETSEPAPELSALCREFIGKPNPYGDPAPNVDQIVDDTIVPTGSQEGCRAAQNETTIAVNPRNPRNLVAGTNDYRLFNAREGRNDSSGWAYTSFDGGRTWRNIQLPHLTFQTGASGALSLMDAAGDPSIAFGAHNTVYYANIAFSRGAPVAGGSQAPGAITVNVSHDGGLTWSEPVIIQIDGVTSAGAAAPTDYLNDKVWVTADSTNGRVYASWTRYHFPGGDYAESPIVVAASKNYGRTFQPFVRADVTAAQFSGGLTPFSQGSNPRVGKHGTLYVAYESTYCSTLACDQPTDRDVTAMAVSHDHGRTFTRHVVGTNYDFPLNIDTGTLTLTGENFRINSFPQLAYDRSRNKLVVTWNDDRNGSYDSDGSSIRTNGDNIVSTSHNGRTWSSPVVLGTPQDEVFGAAAATKGVVAITSYTRHYDPSGVDLDYAYWATHSKLRATSPVHRITTESSDPRIQFVGSGLATGETLQGLFIGDYSAAALGSDFRLHPCWTDFRGRPGVTDPNQDAYTQSISLRRR